METRQAPAKTPAKAPARPVPVQRTWEHASEWVALFFTAAFAAVALLPGAGVPGWYLWAFEVFAAVVVLFVTWAMTGHGWYSLAAGCTGLFLGTWTALAEHTRVWSAETIGLWLGGMVLFIPANALAHASHRGKAVLKDGPRELEAPPDREAQAAEDRRKEIDSYEYMFSKIDCNDVEVLDIKHDRSGRVLVLKLPNTGKVTLQTLESATGKIETILRAAPGAVQFEFGAHSGEIIMRLRERDVMPEKTELRPEFRARTINEKIPVAIAEDGSVLKIPMREIHMMIVGATGKGKSNLLNVLIAQLASCADVIIWVIDLKGGRMARGWIDAWVEGKTEKPALDWVATTREEAALMVQAFEDLITTRTNSGIGKNMINPTPSMPQVVLICDEMADILGDDGPTRVETEYTNNWFITRIGRIGRKGRSEAAMEIMASQRGTNDMGGAGKLKANWLLRVALGTATEQELQWVIPDARRVTRKQLAVMGTTPGVGLVDVSGNTSPLSKFFWCDHPQEIRDGIKVGLCDSGCIPACPVNRISIEVGHGDQRPQLDRITADPLGDVYASRWERSTHLTGGRVMVLERSTQAVATDEFDEIVHGIDPEQSLHPGRIEMRNFLRTRKAFGASVSAITAHLDKMGVGVERETVHRWLQKDRAEGIVHHPEEGRWKYGSGPNIEDNKKDVA